MYNLLIALAAGVVATFSVKPFGFSVWAGLVPGTLVFLGTYIFLARRIAMKVQALSAQAQKELQATPPNERERKQRVEKAIRILEEGLQYDRWQFLVGPELHANIGMIHYMVKEYDKAQAHFAQSSPRNAMAHALQAALFFQRKDYARMEKSFEVAVKSGKKEGLIWSAYAWCLQQTKEKDKALAVMARAVQQNPSDEKLKANLTNLQNDKKLKMKAYEPMWWQFGLESPPLQMTGGRRVQYVRR